MFKPIFISILALFLLVGFSSSVDKIKISEMSIFTKNNKMSPEKDCVFGREKALKDIQNKNPSILMQGGIVSVIKASDKDFEEKYKVSFWDFGCVVSDDIECLIAYNKTIFEYLDKTFGKEWRKEIRKDVIGFRN